MRQLEQDLIANLPSDIIIEILSSLPIRTIINCKCVCKSWLALHETREFFDSHLLKAVARLTLSAQMLYSLYEFEDGLIDLETLEFRCSPTIKYNLNFENGWIGASISGLLLHCNATSPPLALSIRCPISRNYINIKCPHESPTWPVALGFGVCKTSGQYKVVSVFQDIKSCYVSTIGEEEGWRNIAPPYANMSDCCIDGVFLNGNLHWLVSDLKAWISCFDLETECFSTFSSPIMAGSSEVAFCALRDTLCLCVTRPYRIDIWLMKEYGVDKSWTKQYVFHKRWGFYGDQYYYKYIYPIKVFKNGDILMGWKQTNILFYYSKKNKILQRSDMFADTIPFLHTPNFLSLEERM